LKPNINFGRQQCN